MQSEEAKRLESSIANSNNDAAGRRDSESDTNAWNRMGLAITMTNNARVNDDTGKVEAETSLMAKTGKSKASSSPGANPESSIYDNMDKQTKAEKYLEEEDDYLDNPIDAKGYVVMTLSRALCTWPGNSFSKYS
jgi:hypothetical protein